MSLWPRDRVAAWMAPSGVVLARAKSGLRRPQSYRAVQAQEIVPPHAACHARASVAALEQLVARAQCSNAALHVYLSDHFARYALIAWRPGLSGRADWEAYAAHELDTRYGAGGTPRTLRIAHGAPRSPRLVAAIDTELLEALRVVASKARLRLSAIEPNLCRVADRFRIELARSAGFLALLEPGRVGLIGAHDDAWIDLRSARAGADAGRTLAQLLLQSRLRLRHASERVWLWGGGAQVAASLAEHGFAVRNLNAPAALPRECMPLGLI